MNDSELTHDEIMSWFELEPTKFMLKYLAEEEKNLLDVIPTRYNDSAMQSMLSGRIMQIREIRDLLQFWKEKK